MQIDPITSSSVITQSSTTGTRNQRTTTQPGSEAKPVADLTASDGEITLSLSFPGNRASETETPVPEEAVKVANISLNFSRDEETGSIVTKLVDQTSGETVQQIPSEAILHLAATLGKLQGQIIDKIV